MEHKPVSQLSTVADLHRRPGRPLSRRERLDRWAELLEQRPDRILDALDEIEWQPRATWADMRANASAISVAFADPVLRAEGLTDDTLGTALRFFELADNEAHAILCSCHGGSRIAAGEVAHRVRAVRAPRLWALYAGWFR